MLLCSQAIWIGGDILWLTIHSSFWFMFPIGDYIRGCNSKITIPQGKHTNNKQKTKPTPAGTTLQQKMFMLNQSEILHICSLPALTLSLGAKTELGKGTKCTAIKTDNRCLLPFKPCQSLLWRRSECKCWTLLVNIRHHEVICCLKIKFIWLLSQILHDCKTAKPNWALGLWSVCWWFN